MKTKLNNRPAINAYLDFMLHLVSDIPNKMKAIFIALQKETVVLI